jgi:hypothetical protein
LYAETFSDDRNQHVNADGDPDLGFDRVLVGGEKCLDAQMLLDLFEEQLDLPAAFVKLGDCQSWKLEVVGKELQALVVFLVVKTAAAQIADKRPAILRR